MSTKLKRVLNQADTVVALAIVLAVGVLGLAQVTSEQVAVNAILITLGLLAISILRDRTQRGTSEELLGRDLRGLIAEIGAAKDALDNLAPVSELLPSTRRALSEIMAVQILSGSEVGQAHTEARSRTDRWIFKGGTGTYLRAVTLPELYRTARRERRSLLIQLEILDPTNPAVCETYSKFRQSVSSAPDGTGERWTAERVHLESYAMILAACWYRERFGLLDIRVGLSNSMTTFRYDMSSTGLIVTQDDAKIPALLIKRESFLYDSFDTELRMSLEQARGVPLAKASALPLSELPAASEVLRMFELLEIPFVLPESDIPRIVEKALHARNPYA